MNKKPYTPWLLLIIGTIFLVLTSWSIYMARSGTSDVTDRNYYSHGLRYNETLLERKAAQSQGWTLKTQLIGHTLRFELKDKTGKAVISARGTLELLFPEKSTSIRLPLVLTDSGIYEVTLDQDLAGEMTARIEFVQDGARLNRQLLLNL